MDMVTDTDTEVEREHENGYGHTKMQMTDIWYISNKFIQYLSDIILVCTCFSLISEVPTSDSTWYRVHGGYVGLTAQTKLTKEFL
jgi:hypothetical protein